MIGIFCIFLFSLFFQTTKSSDQSISNADLYKDTFHVPEIMSCVYTHLDQKSKENLCLVSKDMREKVKIFKNCYFVTNSNVTGSVNLICSNCFKEEQCDCKALRYRGLFVRKNSDGSMVKAYLPSSYIEPLAEMQKKISHFSHIFQGSKNYVPTQYFAKQNYGTCYYSNQGKIYDGFASYSQVTPPYITEETSDLYVLESIPVINIRKDIQKPFYPLPNLNSVHETFLSQNGKCIRRQAFFNFNETNYPFVILTLFPKLYETYKDRLRNQQCTIIRDEEKAIFYNNDFYVNAEDGMKDVLHNIFNLFQILLSNQPKNQDIYTQLQKTFQDQKIPNSTDFVRFALCTKICGNTHLAYLFLKLYDEISQELCTQYQDRDYLYKQPFGAIIGPCPGWGGLGDIPGETTSDYNFVMNQLTKLSKIPELIAQMKDRKQLRKISDIAAMEIRKDGTTYILYPWKLSNVYYDCHFSVDWLRGPKFTLENYSGTFDTISFDINKEVKNINTITVTETNLENSKEITHILSADGTHTTTSSNNSSEEINHCDDANKDSKNSIHNQQMTRFVYLQGNPIFAYVWNALNIWGGISFIHTKLAQLFVALRLKESRN